MKIKATLEEKQEEKTLRVQTVNIPRRKIILFHVPEHITSDNVKATITKELHLTRDQAEGDWLSIGKTITTNKNTKHVPLLLPLPLALELLDKRRICIGLKMCPIKKYITITRCNKCQRYDHVEANCTYEKAFCAKCSQQHETSKCTSQISRCINCFTYNGHKKYHRHNEVSEHHPTYSPACHVHRQLLTIRQVLLDQGRRPDEVLGYQVTHGEVALSNRNGFPEILDLTRPFRGNGNRRQ